MKQSACSTIAILLVMCAMCGLSFAADAPKPKPTPQDKEAAKAGLAAIKDAAAALTKQFQAYEKDQVANTIETESDYFRKNPNTDITQAQIVAALAQRFGNDVPTDCYVKWQLLSIIVGKFDEAVVPAAFNAYQRAAELPLAAAPGLDHARLDRALAQMGSRAKASMDDVNAQMKIAQAAVDVQNKVILSYRNQLYGLLPASPDVFSVGMEDAVNRMSRGESGDSIMSAVRASASEWAVDATPVELRNVAANLRKLAALGANTKAYPQPYISLDANDKGVVSWRASSVLDTNALTVLADKLEKDSLSNQTLGFKKDN